MVTPLREELRRARILMVDDEATNLRALHRVLSRAGYAELRTTIDSTEVVDLFDAWSPDLLLLDLQMPHLDGFGVIEQLVPRIAPNDYLPIVMLTGENHAETKRRALALGAKDFLAKPFDSVEVLLRIRNLLETRFLHLALANENHRLERRVEERSLELVGAQLEVLERLARAAECRDDDTGEHTRRVGELSASLAEEMQLPSPTVTMIRHAAVLHDIGKVGIPDAVLLNPGRLNSEEFGVMKTHTLLGANILSGSGSPLIQMAERIALAHHERWDGTGYPNGLACESIPLEARLVAVADVFDALTHARPYRQPWPISAVDAEIANQSGVHFDPEAVRIFFARRARNAPSAQATLSDLSVASGFPARPDRQRP